MVSAKTILGATALAALSQTGSAILLTISLDVALGTIGGVMGAAGGLAGGISAAVNNKRSEDTVAHIKRSPVSRVKRQSYGTEYDWQQCHEQLTGSTLNFEGESAGSKQSPPTTVATELAS